LIATLIVTYFLKNDTHEACICMRIIDHFDIPYYQYLNEQGELVDQTIPSAATNIPLLLRLYECMVLVRTMDTKAIALQRTGKLGTYPSTRGQEAVFVGVGEAMAKSDIFVPYYRDMGTLIQRGASLAQILQYWGGDERGNHFMGDDFPFSVPVGSQGLHAAGAAYAIKYFKEKRAVLSICGDGATSQGDFYEALNVAGVWKLPVVFVICNNQWAISVPRQAQTAAHTLAQKAIAAGIPGEQIDGNDVVAVQYRTEEALKAARDHHQPSLLEMVCYRQHDHTTADDAGRYEPKTLRQAEWQKEPIERLRRYLEKKNAWEAVKEQALLAQCALQIDAAINQYFATPPQPSVSMFDYLYATLPPCYRAQRELLANKEQNHG
jgi:pyruvate dehydrogenase E1 component alpha subunit